MTNDELADRIINEYAKARISDDLVFMSYQELAVRLSRPGQERILGDALDRARLKCAERGLPDVTVMIVGKESLANGKVEPSPKAREKYNGWPELRSKQAKAIAYDWRQS